jgi:hypothetical protein
MVFFSLVRLTTKRPSHQIGPLQNSCAAQSRLSDARGASRAHRANRVVADFRRVRTIKLGHVTSR